MMKRKFIKLKQEVFISCDKNGILDSRVLSWDSGIISVGLDDLQPRHHPCKGAVEYV